MDYIIAQRQYRIRKLTIGNKSGDCYGITIPKQIARFFHGSLLTLYISGAAIILESGTNPAKKEEKEEVNAEQLKTNHLLA